MPNLNLEDARYVGRVADALANGQLPPVLRQSCPSCGADHPDPATHVILDGEVILACDGYRVIDPNWVGISTPGWVPSGE